MRSALIALAIGLFSLSLEVSATGIWINPTSNAPGTGYFDYDSASGTVTNFFVSFDYKRGH